MTERAIQIAVARADLILCIVARVLAALLLAAMLLIMLLAVRSGLGYDSEIDYDAPGVDITSEGPDNDVEG